MSDTILSTVDGDWGGMGRGLQILISKRLLMRCSQWSGSIDTSVYHWYICNISKAQMDHAVMMQLEDSACIRRRGITEEDDTYIS